MNALTIVMYHYVRPIRRSRFPGIKGLEVELFREQLKFLLKNYNVVSPDELIQCLKSGEQVPDRSALLTFDDGYYDHYAWACPIMDEYGVKGAFFPPAKPVLEHVVLDVNKIHFTLSSCEDANQLVENIRSFVESSPSNLLPFNEYWDRITSDLNRYDTPEVTFVKRMLQRDLPETDRATLTDELFRRHVTADEGSFAQELYMSVDQLRAMRRQGHRIGNHGYAHYWLNSLSDDAQTNDVLAALPFLESCGESREEWLMCYPYGAYDDRLLKTIEANGCAVGFTTEVALAQPSDHNRLVLPRLDTNDLPKQADASTNEWYARLK